MEVRNNMIKYKIDSIANISKGYPICISTKELNKEIHTSKFIKMLNARNIRELIDGNKVAYAKVEFNQKYNKEIQYVEKNDIVIMSATGTKDKFNILYIDKEPDDKYCYSNSMYVLRVKDEEIISPKYLYIQLLTNKIQEKLISLAKGNQILHITKIDLLNIEIQIPDKKEMLKICNNYDKAIEYENKSKAIMKELLEN